LLVAEFAGDDSEATVGKRRVESTAGERSVESTQKHTAIALGGERT
jgi:hypothetical protein